jgi:hypothetical protein
LIIGVKMCWDASSGVQRPKAPSVMPMKSGMPVSQAMKPEAAETSGALTTRLCTTRGAGCVQPPSNQLSTGLRYQ